MLKGQRAKIYWRNNYIGDAELRNLVCKQEDKELWEVWIDGRKEISCFWIEKDNLIN